VRLGARTPDPRHTTHPSTQGSPGTLGTLGTLPQYALAVATVRKATGADATRLAELRFDFRASVGSPTESRGDFVARCSSWMREMLDRGAWHCWTAELGDAVVGQIWLHVIDKVPNPVSERHRHAYISNLFVLPEARGGVGSRLLEAALAFADAAEVDRVILWPSAHSRSLYVRYGFTPNGEVFERRSS